MLEVGTETLLLESSPEEVLVHGVGVLRPLGELVAVQRELLLELGDILGLLVELQRISVRFV